MKTAKRLASLLLCFVLLTAFLAGTVNVQAQTGGELSIDSFSLDLSSPQPAGSELTMTASGSGGTGGLQYKFSYEKDGAWVRIQDYSKSSSATWRPPEPGNYTITVFIKDSSGTEIAKGIPFTAEDPIPIEVTSFTVDPSSSQPAGSVVSLAASASGGQGEFQYKFSYEKDGKWVRIQDFSPSSQAQWVPMSPGDYTLMVFVTGRRRHGRGKISPVSRDRSPGPSSGFHHGRSRFHRTGGRGSDPTRQRQRRGRKASI